MISMEIIFANIPNLVFKVVTHFVFAKVLIYNMAPLKPPGKIKKATTSCRDHINADVAYSMK